MDYKMTIAGLERHLPLCKVTDDLYIAGFIMFNDVEITEAAARELLKQAPELAALRHEAFVSPLAVALCDIWELIPARA